MPTPRSNVSSPGPDIEPFEDEAALLGDLDADMDEGEGEELFGDNMEKFVIYFKVMIFSDIHLQF